MTPGLFGLLKLAASAAQKLDQHFDTPGNGKKWSTFRRNLRSKGFAEAAKSDPRADKKLKKHVDMVHLHKTGKGPTFQVKGDSGKRYVVKFHSSLGIYSCSCPDWTIKKSQNNGECKHIKKVKSQASMVKEATFALRTLASAGRMANLGRIRESNEEGAWNAGQVNKIHHAIGQERKLRRMG